MASPSGTQQELWCFDTSAEDRLLRFYGTAAANKLPLHVPNKQENTDDAHKHKAMRVENKSGLSEHWALKRSRCDQGSCVASFVISISGHELEEPTIGNVSGCRPWENWQGSWEEPLSLHQMIKNGKPEKHRQPHNCSQRPLESTTSQLHQI